LCVVVVIFDCNRFSSFFSLVKKERLSEAQTRLATAEAEVAQLKERLARCEGAEVDGRQVIQQLEADKSSMAASHEQQRLVFDKCLDEIANHVVQALISQKVFFFFLSFYCHLANETVKLINSLNFSLESSRRMPKAQIPSLRPGTEKCGPEFTFNSKSS
jgi:septal ring factor EnvC (AmiA/AmiB activator)